MGDSGEGLIDAEARIQERMEEMERSARAAAAARRVRDPRARPGARVAEARANRARAAARRDDARAPARADQAGDRGSRSAHGARASAAARSRAPSPSATMTGRSSSWKRCDGRRARGGTCSIRHLASPRSIRTPLRGSTTRAPRSCDALDRGREAERRLSSKRPCASSHARHRVRRAR